jgi:cyclopropane fatty-acyl-phospholipid synthase-like methyltransferase
MLEASEREAIVAYYREMDSSFAHWGGPAAYEMHYGYKESASADHFESLARMNAVVADLASVRPLDVVLDAGCGVGATALWLAENRAAVVHGISVSDLQIGKARRAAVSRGLASRVHFSVQDYTATEFADASFDVVWAMESLCHARRKEEFLRESRRLLRAGGRVAVADYFLTREPADACDHAALRTWAAGWAMSTPLGEGAFKDLLRDCGFRRVRSHDLTDAIRPDADEMCRRGREGLLEDVLHATPRRLAHVQACIAQKQALDRGLWRYLVFVGENRDG